MGMSGGTLEDPITDGIFRPQRAAGHQGTHKELQPLPHQLAAACCALVSHMHRLSSMLLHWSLSALPFG
jgi:hypothetical protein